MVRHGTKLIRPVEPLIISIKEMRKVMGKGSESLSDNQIENLIITLTEASSILLNQKMVPKKRQVE